jgi:hypothetical protein
MFKFQCLAHSRDFHSLSSQALIPTQKETYKIMRFQIQMSATAQMSFIISHSRMTSLSLSHRDSYEIETICFYGA